MPHHRRLVASSLGLALLTGPFLTAPAQAQVTAVVAHRSVAAATTALGAPQNLVAKWTSSGVHLTWSPPAGVDPSAALTYRIYVGPTASALQERNLGVDSTDFDDGSALAGAVYVYGVAAIDANGNEGARATTQVGSTDGSHVFVTATATDGSALLGVVDKGGSSIQGLESSGGFYGDLSVSPDGSTLAYTRLDRTTGASEVWVRPTSAPAGDGKRLLSGSIDWDEPAWSPDSSTLVVDGTSYDTSGNPSTALYTVGVADGSSQTEVPRSQDLSHPSYGGPGWLIAEDDADPNLALPLVRVNLADGTRSDLSSPDGYLPTVSPDHTRVAYVSDTGTGGQTLMLAPVQGGGAQQLSVSGLSLGSPTWSREGSWIQVPVEDSVTKTWDIWQVRPSGDDLSRATATTQDEVGVADAGDTVAPVFGYPPSTDRTASNVSVSYQAVDGTGSGVASYDVRSRVGIGGGAFSAYTVQASGTTSTSFEMPGTPVHTYCFSVRARDKAGNVSAWTADSCLTVPNPPSHELNGPQGLPVLVDRTSNGDLYFTTYLGSTLSQSGDVVGRGWQGMTAILVPGDVDGNGVDDVLARDSAGRLWLYPRSGASNGAGWMTPRQIGSGWQGMTAILATPDMTGDGHPDLLARDSAGRLWLYPMNGHSGWLPQRQVGTGWQSMTAITAPGDFDGDGNQDLLARDTYGRLWLYPTDGHGSWLPRRQVGSGWQVMNQILTTGDFDGDQHPDLVARDTSGRLWLYPGNGRGSWLSPKVIGTGWSGPNLIA